jgi:hypothetical protein
LYIRFLKAYDLHLVGCCSTFMRWEVYVDVSCGSIFKRFWLLEKDDHDREIMDGNKLVEVLEACAKVTMVPC